MTAKGYKFMDDKDLLYSHYEIASADDHGTNIIIQKDGILRAKSDYYHLTLYREGKVLGDLVHELVAPVRDDDYLIIAHEDILEEDLDGVLKMVFEQGSLGALTNFAHTQQMTLLLVNIRNLVATPIFLDRTMIPRRSGYFQDFSPFALRLISPTGFAYLDLDETELYFYGRNSDIIVMRMENGHYGWVDPVLGHFSYRPSGFKKDVWGQITYVQPGDIVLVYFYPGKDVHFGTEEIMDSLPEKFEPKILPDLIEGFAHAGIVLAAVFLETRT